MHRKILEVSVLKVGKCVSLDFDDLQKVRKKVLEGESANLSEYIRKAIKEKLKR